MPASAVAQGPDLQPAPLPALPAAAGDRWRAHVYAHTHWDREWYRTFERFRMQLVGVVDRLLATLDADPSFATYVLDGQTIVLEDYLELRPEEEPRLRRLIGAGRIEVGPWYVLPDEFLVSGESLVRNLLEGRRIAARFGEPLAVGYLPDPFGHVAQLPAILRGFGIDNVLFSRGMGDEFARVGPEFRWESPAGVDVLALVQLSTYTSGYCNAELLGRGHGADDPAPYELVRELAPHLASRARTNLLLVAAGCDHETIQAELPLIVERMRQQLPEADVELTGLDAAVATARAAERRLEDAGEALERWRGELRGSLQAPILSSIFSARVPLKQRNDELQVLLERHVEPLLAAAVAAGVRPARDVEPFLRHAWRLVLQNHPHDSIGGCSVDEVHEEMHARTLRARATCHGLVEDLRIATGTGVRADLHDAEGLGGIAERGDGTPVAVRAATPGVLVDLDSHLLHGGAELLGDRGVRAGELVAEVLDDDDGAPRLQLRSGDGAVHVDWVDDGDAGDEYDWAPVEGSGTRHARLEGWATRSAGPGVAELELRYVLELPAGLDEQRRPLTELVRHELLTRVRVSEASPLAQLVVELDNQARDHRLRLRVTPTDAADATSRVEALGHFAIIERPARPAVPASTWRQQPPGLDHCLGAVRLLPSSASGRPVLVAGRGLHEYEVRPVDEAQGTHALELTVLRAVGWLSRDDIATRPGHAGPALATPGAQCLGPQRVDVAIGVGSSAQFAPARAFLAPPLVFEPFGVGQSARGSADPSGAPIPLESGALARARDVLLVTPDDALARIEALGLELGGDGVVPAACKLADDGSGDLVVRWWAPTTATNARARVRIAAPVRSVQRARLDETTLGPAPFEDGRCEVAVKPGAITTLRIALAREPDPVEA